MRTGGWGAGLVMLGVGWVDGAMSVRMEAGWSGHGAGPHQPTLPPTLYTPGLAGLGSAGQGRFAPSLLPDTPTGEAL